MDGTIDKRMNDWMEGWMEDGWKMDETIDGGLDD